MLPRKEPCAKLVRDLGGIDFLRSDLSGKWGFEETIENVVFLRKWMEHLF